MFLLIRWLINAGALLILANYMPGIFVFSWGWALLAVLILGLVNAILKPVLLFFTLPINILTLGLFTFVINALLFWLVGSVLKGFVVVGFWPAFWGALVMTIVGWVVNGVLKK